MAQQAELPQILNPEQRLKLAQVSILTGKGRTAIYADMKAGRFPQPERDGPRCSRWRAGDVLDHLNRKRGA
ncbi:helix-turn-helix transcriptional regulator [Variovorax ginsengisoli]|uniref:AlpA family phage regulatory protein n=1 Tax=Variovorax ginsengisoli TaxID=363844 RepID=A0ABT8S771_9BURK|nr:AlpA family phage regulatory protein [Variovorax ginsengisoli]MDN8615483.1 AlpA family phage regulatory protein [Variovorax ginsengisoli]MDO1534653.1 AlpA family phage regulatory protein [Variovorax ginsengisoli]